MNPNTLKHWLNRGEIEKLEHVVLEGRGARLLGERSPDLRTRVFLKGLPNYLTKISQIHEAVTRGSLLECQKLIAEEPKKKFPLAKDSTGTPLLHKAVYYDHIDIVDWLIQQFPATVQQKDREGRTALHYCAACRDIDSVWDVLIEADCDASICDKRGNPAAYYLEHQSELELPETERMSGRKIANNKERIKNNYNSHEQQITDFPKNNLDFKPSNIRIWIHNKDIGKLQRVLWEGHGSKLRCETSNNPRVKKFLEAVPFIMGTIKEIHARTIKNDVEGFKRKIAEPVSPIILCSKDGNGLNVLHKAAGLGHIEIVKEILELYPAAVLAADNDGKTPLHYAAAAKDEGLMYNLLVEFGADEGKVDHKFKAPAFYKNRPSDVDMSALLVVPDAPRVSGTYPKNWDWRILETDDNVIRDMRKSTSKIAEITEIDETFDAPNGGESPTKMKNGTHKTEPETKEAEEEAAPNSPAEDKQEEGSPEFQSPEQQSPLPEENAENEGEPNEIDEKGENEEIGENDENDENELEKNDEITEEEKNEDNAEEEKVENNIEDDLNNTEKDVNENITTEQEERNDASTGDSGVDDPTNEDFHVILDEQEEEDPQESDVNENGLDLDEESDDPEIEKLTQTGNMEQLAELVLNGEGRRLVGRQTSNPELQSFIDNVPAFMGKIHAVHMAAREGNLRDLQSALDRRKFAIARDESSPRGATALHVAVIFGHTTIIRYFAGRFPETANAVDLDGRTPLHYAATLADNGHYFNLLVHLGANPQIQDKLGHKAEYYKQNQEELSHKKLLRSFGAQESLADEMLNDKGNSEKDGPVFDSEDQRYLADSLGNPLIKGLTEVVKSRPEDPESNVLIIDDRDEETNIEDDDLGYPQTPENEPDPSDTQEINPGKSNFNDINRDEHGQSILHFAAVRSHTRDSLFNLLQESQINIAYRDETYRTGRDVAETSHVPDNAMEIDRWVVFLAARGETEKLVELLLEGYDHILDTSDDGENIVDVAKKQGHESTVQFLQSIPNFESRREELHSAIRANNAEMTRELFIQNGDGAKLIAFAKNVYGRCAIHIAVLRENAEIVEFIAENYPETLAIGDNLERTALHYAMALPSIEVLSTILIKAGAKRIRKDLRSRQPSYYYMNKTEIQKLQEEEDEIIKM
ncbi:uncharacterized protein LOC122510441 isoform X4 [Leptopilina heterotoma]|uniref:uncharacterized protein LOC122510441 isoform X4 n=1 Tax=Leptopilina heterotoma TaxID=63436 RepID=UPI001CA952ED|nr:uncharacterized protein LOC122510441 isoform X4 [Leptopilina heterotoma]